MSLTTLFAIPLVLLSQGYTLVVKQINGEKIEIPAENVVDITFEADETPVIPDDPKPDDPKPDEPKPDEPKPSGIIVPPSDVFVPSMPTFTPGATGTIFPPGVSPAGGFVDVDKLGVNPWYTDDADFCSGCAFANIMAWWLNDYKAVMGKDYPLTHPLPTVTHYVTPVMDAFCSANYYNSGGGDCYMNLEWFIVGVDYNQTINGVTKFNETYPYWKGGFLGMTEEEMRQNVLNLNPDLFGYTKPQNTYYWGDPYFKNASKEEFTARFSQHVIETLLQGPFYFGVFNHAETCFGAEYKVNANGTPELTALYVCENSKNIRGEGNTLNGMQLCKVHFEEVGGTTVCWVELPAMSASNAQTTDIRKTVAVKSVRFNKAD